MGFPILFVPQNSTPAYLYSTCQDPEPVPDPATISPVRADRYNGDMVNSSNIPCSESISAQLMRAVNLSMQFYEIMLYNSTYNNS